MGADQYGVFLSVGFPWCIGHPPLFIPWSDVAIEKQEQFVCLRFRNSPRDCLLMYEETASELLRLPHYSPEDLVSGS
jgi:hypothetical protein